MSQQKLRGIVNKYNASVRKYNSEAKRFNYEARKQQSKIQYEFRQYESKRRQAIAKLKSAFRSGRYTTPIQYQLKIYESSQVQADLSSLDIGDCAEEQISRAALLANFLEKNEESQEQEDPMTDDPIFQGLSRINPLYGQEWRSACHAFEADAFANPSCHRHFGASVRELITMILHDLSPDSVLINWSKTEYDKNGKPTRRSRFRYIFQNSSSIADYLESVVENAVSLVSEDLNHLTHMRNPSHANQLAVKVKNQAITTIDLILKAINNS